MNWQKAAIEDLKKYGSQKQSLDNIRERIEVLSSKYEAIKGVETDREAVQGGLHQIEDKLLDNIVERERLKYTYHATERLVKLIDRGLSGLDEREKRVLEKFYIEHQIGHVEGLMDELHLEQRRIYQIKDGALYRFTISMYGMVEY